MSLGYQRCPEDECKGGIAALGIDPNNGKVVEADIHVISAIVAVHAALLSLSSTMKTGHEEDFLEKVAFGLVSKIAGDPHSLCPLVNLMGLIGVLATNNGTTITDDEGRLMIVPLNRPPGDIEYPEPTCPLTDWMDPDEDDPATD